MANRFGDDDFLNGSEGDYNFDYEEGEEFDEGDQGAMIGASIPAELMDRWKQSEVNLEVQKSTLSCCVKQ